MPTRLHVLLCAALLAAACHDSGEPEAPLPDVCGAPGPHRVLAHGPDQALAIPPVQIGERVFYRVGDTDPGGASHPLMPFGNDVQWTTGPCGESPTRVPDAYSDPFEVERWPGVALACDRANNSIVSFSASGPLAPHAVFADLGCDPIVSEFGPIDHTDLDDHSALLTLHPWPDDPRTDTAEPQLLIPAEIRAQGGHPRIELVGAELFALDTGDRLLRVALPGGEVKVEQTDVAQFDVSPDGRYLVTQTPAVELNGRLGNPVLYDRQTGVGLSLGDGSISLAWVPDDLIVLTSEDGQRIFNLPGLGAVDVPVNHHLDGTQSPLVRGGGPLADGRWVVQSYEDGALRYLDLTNGELTPMFSRSSQIVAHDPSGAVVLQVPLCCTENNRADDEGPLWSVPHDGAPPQLLRDRATLFTYRPNDRQLVTLVDIGDRRDSSMILIDRDGARERALDDHVYANYFSLSIAPELIRYSVQDGERSGVWLAKLPPP